MKRWFVVLPLLLAACAQAQDYPAPVQALASKGVTIKGELPAPAGIKGYVGSYQGKPMPVYLLADGKHVVIGTLFDADGNDLTQQALQAATAPSLSEATWAELGNSNWIAEGSSKPKRIVYVFTDTECPYCQKLWMATQPLLVNSNIQVRHIMVAVIAPKSLTRAAAILDASDPKAALHQHETTFGHSTIQPLESVPAATEKRIAANIGLMEKLGIQGTPATVYKDAAGKIHIAAGMLPDNRLKAIFAD